LTPRRRCTSTVSSNFVDAVSLIRATAFGRFVVAGAIDLLVGGAVALAVSHRYSSCPSTSTPSTERCRR